MSECVCSCMHASPHASFAVGAVRTLSAHAMLYKCSDESILNMKPSMRAGTHVANSVVQSRALPRSCRGCWLCRSFRCCRARCLCSCVRVLCPCIRTHISHRIYETRAVVRHVHYLCSPLDVCSASVIQPSSFLLARCRLSVQFRSPVIVGGVWM